jgi:hypothetical protein
MATWVPAFTSLSAVCIGALLTMLGQTLSDRRARNKDTDARKEEFRLKNFEIQRDALLQMQEILNEFSRKVLLEKIRRETDEYPIFDKQPLTSTFDLKERIASQLKIIKARVSEMSNPASREDRKWLNIASKQFVRYAEQANDEAQRFVKRAEVLDGRLPFSDAFLDFIYQLRLRLYRCGSNRIMDRGEAYIKGVVDWNESLVSAGLEEHTDSLNELLYDLNKEIAERLYRGPYPKSK